MNLEHVSIYAPKGFNEFFITRESHEVTVDIYARQCITPSRAARATNRTLPKRGHSVGLDAASSQNISELLRQIRIARTHVRIDTESSNLGRHGASPTEIFVEKRLDGQRHRLYVAVKLNNLLSQPVNANPKLESSSEQLAMSAQVGGL